MVGLELFSARELVRHFVLHAIDVLAVDLHFLVHAALKIGDLLEIRLTGLNLHLEGSCRAFRLVQLPLLEVQVLFHLFDLIDAGQGSLPIQVLVHVLEKRGDGLLSISHLSLHLLLLSLILLSKIVDLLFLGVKYFELLLAAHSTTGAF